MDNTLYYIWLQRCFGTKSKKLKQAVSIFGSTENIYKADKTELISCGLFSDKELERLSDKDMTYSQNTIENCERLGYKVYCYNEKKYPKRLSLISAPPVVLYVLGELPDEAMPHCAVVGTRNPDETGKRLSYSFSYDIAKDRGVVVSGGALGVDNFAHRGALDADGVTICVLGCGIDKYTLSVSDYLINNVPAKGAIISEYPPGYPPTLFSFPQRNRIISGLSECTLVVQAGFGSGALITVKYALEQGRKLFAVPGNMGNAFCAGTNYMLRCGVSAAMCGNDLLTWIRSHEISGDENLIAPCISDKQLEILSKKPEVTAPRKTESFKMPAVDCYEFVRSVSDGSDIDFGNSLSGSQMKLNEAEAKPDISEKMHHPEAAEKDNAKTDKPEFWLDEDKNDKRTEDEIISQNLRPTFSLDKKSFLALFEPYGSRQSDVKGAFQGRPADRGSVNEAVPGKTKGADEKKTGHSEKILKNDNLTNNNIQNIQKKNNNIPEQLTDNARTVYDTFSDTPVFMDTIAELTGISVGELLSSLTELELYGLIEKLPGNKYAKK